MDDEQWYYVLQSDEDGISIEKYSREQLEKKLADEIDDGTPVEFHKVLPKQDKGCFISGPEDGWLIIRGDIVVPKAVEVVKKFRLGGSADEISISYV